MTDTPTALPEQLGFTTTWYDLPGLRVHAATAGPADGPLLVLLHGFPEFWYSWRHLIAPLAEAGFRVVAPDQRGYNLTDKTPPYDIFTLVQDVVALIEACGEQDAFVVGHDWGAAVAWSLAIRHPERVRRLAILNVPHPALMVKSLTGGNLRQMTRSWYIFFFQIPWLPEALLSANRFYLARQMMLRSSRRGTFGDDALAALASAWGQPGALRAMIGWYRAFLRLGARQARAGETGQWSQRVTVPTRIVWGERDVALGVALAEGSLEYCDDAALVRLPRATHWVHEEFPDEVLAELLDHLGRPGGAPQPGA